MMEIEAYLKKDYITKLVNENKRIDGREFDEFRKIEIEKDYVSEKSCGSALVRLGDTKVLVGISMNVGAPYSDRPESGVMITGVESRPIASPTFESGPPSEKAIEIARVVDRGIRESGSIDVDKLFIEDGKIWMVFIDIHMLDHSGNLIDASGIAAMTALLNTRIPKYEDGEVIRGEWSGNLPISCVPIPCTTAKIADKLVVDPNMDEEYAMDARLTVATTTDTINAMQKGGNAPFKEKEIMDAIDMSFDKAKEIRKLVE